MEGESLSGPDVQLYIEHILRPLGMTDKVPEYAYLHYLVHTVARARQGDLRLHFWYTIVPSRMKKYDLHGGASDAVARIAK